MISPIILLHPSIFISIISIINISYVTTTGKPLCTLSSVIPVRLMWQQQQFSKSEGEEEKDLIQYPPFFFTAVSLP